MESIKENLNTLGGRLRYARTRLGLSQSELARRTGVKQPSINQLETGGTKNILGTQDITWSDSGRSKTDTFPSYQARLTGFSFAYTLPYQILYNFLQNYQFAYLHCYQSCYNKIYSLIGNLIGEHKMKLTQAYNLGDDLRRIQDKVYSLSQREENEKIKERLNELFEAMEGIKELSFGIEFAVENL